MPGCQNFKIQNCFFFVVDKKREDRPTQLPTCTKTFLAGWIDRTSPKISWLESLASPYQELDLALITFSAICMI